MDNEEEMYKKKYFRCMILPENINFITGSSIVYKSVINKPVAQQSLRDLLDSIIPFVKFNFSKINTFDFDTKAVLLEQLFIVGKDGKYFYDYSSEDGHKWVYHTTLMNALSGEYPEGCTNIKNYDKKFK